MSATAYVVIDHHLDTQAGVYRLVIGREIWQEVVMLDEHGAALFDQVPLRDSAGDPVVGDDDEPVMVPGPPMTERKLVGYEDVRDFVFAKDDDRWSGKRAKDVAALHRQLVRDALEPAPPAPDPEVEQLPGVGDAL